MLLPETQFLKNGQQKNGQPLELPVLALDDRHQTIVTSVKASVAW